MSGDPCNCQPPDRSNWRIATYKGNYSAFSGYRFTPSDYSEIICLTCRRSWRTKAKYVSSLKSATHEEKLRP